MTCVRSAGKHPIDPDWPHAASSDPVVVRRWLRRYPGLNVGVATGPGSGLWMLGPDGEPGLQALAGLEERHGRLPPTPTARRGGGGRHYLFRWPEKRLPGAEEIGPWANLGGLPIDTRGKGGQFVAPPSLHPSGRRYEWEVPPWKVKVAPAPGWLYEWLMRVRAPRSIDKKQERRTTDRRSGSMSVRDRACRYLAKCKPAVSGEEGHKACFFAARVAAWGFDLGAETAFEVLWSEYNPRCLPPWSERELWHKVRDADVRPCRLPRGWLLEGGRGRGAELALSGEGMTT